MLDPDAFRNDSAQATVLKGALGAAEQIGHSFSVTLSMSPAFSASIGRSPPRRRRLVIQIGGALKSSKMSCF
ncbi:MAG: hypothetical protein EOP84_30805 [Verrucomicrobiaceae bacterium]|nr:MAG: hypothetical protein EOP84_30805 [Verrucomicrobiaceae bacterium]